MRSACGRRSRRDARLPRRKSSHPRAAIRMAAHRTAGQQRKVRAHAPLDPCRPSGGADRRPQSIAAHARTRMAPPGGCGRGAMHAPASYRAGQTADATTHVQRPDPSTPARAVRMGYTDLYIFLIPLYGLSLGMSAGEIGLLVGGALVAGGVSVDPCRRADGPVRHAAGHAVLCLDRRSRWRRCFRWCRGSGRCCCCRSSMAARCPSPGRGRRP